MDIQTISTKELREDFSQILAAMEAGQKLILLYRSKPIAEIKPFPQKKRRGRTFTAKQLMQWIVDDKLSEKQQRQINAIIKRLP